ncbi:hypothetical protein [Paenibacillus herberti]|nr:hypothetical protein [Paenibacillus herberti]
MLLLRPGAPEAPVSRLGFRALAAPAPRSAARRGVPPQPSSTARS